MIRRLVTVLTMCGLLALAPIATVSADTTGGPPSPIDVYVMGTGFSFTDRAGAAWSGIAQIEDNRLLGLRTVSFAFWGEGAQRRCDGGTPDDPDDDYVGTEYIEFFGSNPRIVSYALAGDLSDARASLVLRGSRARFDACTGELRSERTEVHTFKFGLRPVGPPDVSVETNCAPIEEGSSNGIEVTQTFSYADASGPVILDGRTVTQTWGNLQHLVATLGASCVPTP